MFHTTPLRVAVSVGLLSMGAAATFASGSQIAAAKAAPREVQVIAKRFSFEPEQIEVTQGERIRLLVTSSDGVHGLQIKKFNVNKLIPRGGKPVTIEFTASAPGTFPILCSEECGEGHELMRGALVVTARAK